MKNSPAIIEIKNLTTGYTDKQIIHQNLNLTVYHGERLALVGASGSGKTTLLQCLLMLLPARAGEILLFGQSINFARPIEREKLRLRCGVLFQSGALFSGLTVAENILFPLTHSAKIHPILAKKLMRIKLDMVGFPASALNKYPAELSGGMIKRVAMARAIALDPELLFLDEPSAGLDPESAYALDELILGLSQALHLTLVMITHDLDSLANVAERIAFLGEGKVLACAPLESLLQHSNPQIYAYFHNARAQRAFAAQKIE